MAKTKRTKQQRDARNRRRNEREAFMFRQRNWYSKFLKTVAKLEDSSSIEETLEIGYKTSGLMEKMQDDLRKGIHLVPKRHRAESMDNIRKMELSQKGLEAYLHITKMRAAKAKAESAETNAG